MTDQDRLLTKNEVATRWKCSKRTLDRLRLDGKLPWLDLTQGAGAKPLVRFKAADIEFYENHTRMGPFEGERKENGKG